jgi:hypothetical protein
MTDKPCECPCNMLLASAARSHKSSNQAQWILAEPAMHIWLCTYPNCAC